MTESDDEELLAMGPETLPYHTVRFVQPSTDGLKLLATIRLEDSTVKQTKKWSIKVFRCKQKTNKKTS